MRIVTGFARAAAFSLSLIVAIGTNVACAGEDNANSQAGPQKGNKQVTSSDDPTGVEAIRAFIAEQSIDKSNGSWKKHLPKPPQVAFDAGQKYFWVLDTTHGSMKIELLADGAPMHVSSTIYLTELGFYDDVIFHRVITGFMAQGGDPTGSGRGGPGYQYDGEFDGPARHDQAGILSMANAGPGTDGSQFFLTFGPTPHLDGKHTVFGRLVEGQGTLKELEKRGSRGGAPTEPMAIRHASIVVE